MIGYSGPDLKLRFSLRGASLLGNTQDERFELFKRLADAYEARNHLVHGSSKGDFTKVDVETLSHIAGRAILKMIDLSDLNVKKEEIFKATDSLLFSRKENEAIDEVLARFLTEQ